MRKNIVLFALFLMGLSFLMQNCKSNHEENQKGTEVNFKTPTDSTQKTNIKDGPYLEKYPNGKKKMEGVYTNGKRSGLWMAWYENGTLWSQGNYLHGMRNGYSALYYPDGEMRTEGSYRNNKRIGNWVFYKENGSVEKEINYDTSITLKP
jgi:antitoxin component YwqK of YwqJK toxin-antitoxin module